MSQNTLFSVWMISSGLCMYALFQMQCGILTDFGCHYSDIVLNSCLSVQVFISGNGSFNSVNVQTAVRLCLPFQGIPVEMRAVHMRGKQVTVMGWVLGHQRAQL